jgi:hypothetical protein
MDKVVSRVDPVQCRWQRLRIKCIRLDHLNLGPAAGLQNIAVACGGTHACALSNQRVNEIAADIATRTEYEKKPRTLCGIRLLWLQFVMLYALETLK